MVMSTSVAQIRIQRELSDAEQALNDALIKQSALFTTMLVARRDTGAEPFLGQDALLRLTKAQQSLLAAGGDLARVHGRMIDINQEVTGDMAQPCPDELIPVGGEADVSFVA